MFYFFVKFISNGRQPNPVSLFQLFFGIYQCYIAFLPVRRRQVKHHIHHYRLHYGTQPTCTKFEFNGLVHDIIQHGRLERQIHSLFYERLLSSHYDESVRNEIYTLEPKKEVKPTDILKSTYILEFLGLEDNTKYHEKELEQAIIDNLQKFLLELGRGFTFVERQKRLAIGSKNFYIDLVFYNYVLKCFVLIDLKIGEITHQDIGQMQMYTNYYKRELMNEGDNFPIGLVLGAEADRLVMEYTFPENNEQIFTAKYKELTEE